MIKQNSPARIGGPESPQLGRGLPPRPSQLTSLCCNARATASVAVGAANMYRMLLTWNLAAETLVTNRSFPPLHQATRLDGRDLPVSAPYLPVRPAADSSSSMATGITSVEYERCPGADHPCERQETPTRRWDGS